HGSPPVAERGATRRVVADPAHAGALRTGVRDRERGDGNRGGALRPGHRAPRERDPAVCRRRLRRALRGTDRRGAGGLLRGLRARGAAPLRRRRRGRTGRGRPRGGVGCARLERVTVAILDLDGTLVDTNYQHAIAWYRAFRDNGLVLPVWRVHRHIGMGGDQLVGALAGERVEEQRGEAIRQAEKQHYMQMIGEVEAMAGARELAAELRRSGRTVV